MIFRAFSKRPFIGRIFVYGALQQTSPPKQEAFNLEKSVSNQLSLATASILRQTPRRLSENREPTAEKPFRLFFPLIFVKYNQYSPQISEKNNSKWLSLATASILGQTPRQFFNSLFTSISCLSFLHPTGFPGFKRASYILRVLRIVPLLLPLMASADVIKEVDSEGLITWQLLSNGLKLKLVQRLPDQTRAFFQGRGFSADIANKIASSCVFQTIGENISEGEDSGSVSIALDQWLVKYAHAQRPIKLKETWDREWPEGSVSKASRIAFHWAMFPTKQSFEPGGDYGWGMTSFGLPPGAKFDLHVFWKLDGQVKDDWIKHLECAKDR